MSQTGLASYDDGNVFAKILRGEIPCKKIYEDEWALAFHDIHPQTPVHVLVIPKGPYRSFSEFSAQGSDAELAGFVRAIDQVTRMLGVEDRGYRLLTNTGEDAGQEVPHFHVHIFGGKPLGRIISA